MKTQELLNTENTRVSRTPILAGMLEQLTTQVDNPVLASSPAIKEMQQKAKDKL